MLDSGWLARSWNEFKEGFASRNLLSWTALNKPYLVTEPDIFFPLGRVIDASKLLISLPATIWSK